MIQEITIKVDVPEGYELTGEFRPPGDDTFITCEGNVLERSRFNNIKSPRLIVRKVVPFDGVVKLKRGWISKDEFIHWSSDKPVYAQGGWTAGAKTIWSQLHIEDPFPPDLPLEQCIMEIK